MIKPYTLKNGETRYYYIAYIGIDPLTGKEKRVRKSGFKTQKKARMVSTIHIFEARASIKEVQERLGHEDIKTTMTIYTHVTESTKEKTAEKFAQFLAI